MEFEHDTEFIAKQLLEITKLLDFSDEAGRRNLIALLGKEDNCPIFINQYIQIQFLLFQSLGPLTSYLIPVHTYFLGELLPCLTIPESIIQQVIEVLRLIEKGNTEDYINRLLLETASKLKEPLEDLHKPEIQQVLKDAEQAYNSIAQRIAELEEKKSKNESNTNKKNGGRSGRGRKQSNQEPVLTEEEMQAMDTEIAELTEKVIIPLSIYLSIHLFRYCIIK